MSNFLNLNDLEQLTNPLEEIGDTKDLTRDIPVIGFDKITNFEGKEIIDYIKDVIPGEHLEGCSEIIYNPDNQIFREDSDILGLYHTDTHQIEIASQDLFETVDDMLDTVVHEIGHNEHANLERIDEQAAERWAEIYDESWNHSDGLGFVSEYAKTNQYEDFAESYNAYIRDPELLKFMNPAKYEFFKINIFMGREFAQISTEDGRYQTVDISIANTLADISSDEITDDNQVIITSDHNNPVADTYRCFSMIA